MATKARWKQAQEYEQGFWEGVASEIADDSLGRIDFYEWRAGELRKRLDRLGLGWVVDGSSDIAEFGSGPVGVIGFLPGGRRIAVDPLNRFYSRNEHLTRLRDPSVEYLEVEGEATGLPAGSFDMVVMENCIDHTQDPEAVMREIRRILRPGGVLYLTVNGRSRPGYYVHRALARLALDPGHPHTYTAGRFRRMVERHGFEVAEFEVGSWWAAWKEDLLSARRRPLAKAVLGVSEHLLSAVATRGGDGNG
jgi:SAM-dependent methyltransferase